METNYYRKVFRGCLRSTLVKMLQYTAVRIISHVLLEALHVKLRASSNTHSQIVSVFSL